MLAVSIVAYHSRPDHIATGVRAVIDQGVPPRLVRVHVNDDCDGSARVQLQAALPSGVVVTGSVHNLGFAGAHNAAVAELFETDADAVVVHNPDLVLEAGALDALESAQRELGAALLGPVLELADEETLAGIGRIDTAGTRWTVAGRHLDVGQGKRLAAGTTQASAGAYRTAAISGACVLVPRSAHAIIVGRTGELFDADFIAYREDAELGFRASIVGVPSYVVPGARGRHARRLRGTSRTVSDHANRLSVQNRFLIAFKYGRRRPGVLPVVLGRDLTVIAGVLLRERTSIEGLRRAWQLRHRMREKGKLLRASAERMAR